MSFLMVHRLTKLLQGGVHTTSSSMAGEGEAVGGAEM